MNEPIPFPTRVTADRAAAILEEMADGIRTGKLSSIGFAAVQPDGSIDSWYHLREGSVFSLLGAFSYLQHRLSSEVIEPSGD